MADDTPFVESNALLAAVREDWTEARRHLSTMTVHELRAFAFTLNELEAVIQDVKCQKVTNV